MTQITTHTAIYTCTLETPLGEATAAAENGSLMGLWFSREKYFPVHKNSWIYQPDHPVFNNLQTWLAGYFSGENSPINLRLSPKGTDFQKVVWNVLLKIPFGQVTTYGEIARVMAPSRRMSPLYPRAVGNAVGYNPISILIPCHRVVGSDRSLTGYAGGLDKKESLLRIEGINLATVKMYKLC
jgi:methylated-DNA-[protein]-cysteine S-methyltransferase